MLRTVTLPGGYPVSLAEAKAQLRIDVADTGSDTIVNALIPAATAFCQSLVQRVYIARTMEWVLAAWPAEIRLPIAPVLAAQVASVKYVDASGVQQTLDPSLYVKQTVGPGVRIVPKSGMCWPLLSADAGEAVVIRFDAGHADPGDIPGNVKAAILLMLRHLYTLGENSLTLARETAFGVGSLEFLVPANLQTLIPGAVRDLMLDEAW